jgi:hypothetical protein
MTVKKGCKSQVAIELMIILILGLILILPAFNYLYFSVNDLHVMDDKQICQKSLLDIVEKADWILSSGDGSSELYIIKTDYDSIEYSNNYLYMHKSNIGSISVHSNVHIDVHIVGSQSKIRIVNNNGVIGLW